MKKLLRAAMVLPMVALWPVACSVEQTEEGDLPDVEVEGGQLPAYDVDPARVDITTDTKTVTVPDIDVTAPNDTVRDTTSIRNQ